MKVDIKKVDNVIAKVLIFESKGDFMQGHLHTFDHIHLVGDGLIEVFIDDVSSGIFKQGDMINIKANKKHNLVCVSDSAVSWCIHALKEDELNENEFKSITY